MKKTNPYSRADRQRRHDELTAAPQADFDFWALDAWLRHPVRTNKPEAWLAFRTVFENAEKKELFSRHHKLWCDTTTLRRDYTTLVDFIRSETYRNAPGPVFRTIEQIKGQRVIVETMPCGEEATAA